MSKYSLEINYLVPGCDISKEELLEIIEETDRVIAETAGNPEKTAEAYLKKSQCLQKLGKYAESRAPIKKALALFPDMVEAIVTLGNIYEKEKNYNGALAAYNRAIHINPGYAAAFTSRGNVYYGKRKWEKAIADYTESIRLKPDNGIAFYNRADVYGEQVNFIAEAEADWDEAIRRYPGLKDTFTSSHTVGGPIGDIKTDWSDNKDIANLTTAIFLRPNNARLLNNRAWKYAKYGEYDRAIADWTEAIRLSPKDTFSLKGRGDIYAKKGDYDKAIADYTEAIRLYPDNQQTFEKRGAAYEALGQHDKAAADRGKAVRLKQKLMRGNPGLSISESDWVIEFVIGMYLMVDWDKKLNINEILETEEQPEKLAVAYLRKSLSSFLAGNEQKGEEFLAKALDIYSGMNQAEAKRLKSAFLADFIDGIPRVLNVFDKEITEWAGLIEKYPKKSGPFLNNRGNNYAKKAGYYKVIAEWIGAMGAEPEAGERFQTYTSDYDRAIADYTAAIKSKGLNPEQLGRFYQNRGILYTNLGDYDKAIADYNEARRLSPDSTADFVELNSPFLEYEEGTYREKTKASPGYL